MSKREPSLLIEDIIESAERIEAYTEGQSFEDFKADNKTIDAVIRNFEIIGEAANNLSQCFKEENSGVDWHRIRGFRNRIVHAYFGIDYEVVWQVKELFLPALIEQLRNIKEK